MNKKDSVKILAVDDEQASLNAIFRTLRQKFEVLQSLNAYSALEILKKEEVAVILADQRMPQMTGVELFKKSLEIQPDAVRILITGYTDIEATIQSINDGNIFYYINKPWEPSDLILIITRAADRYQLIKENKRLMIELKKANQQLKEENIVLHQEVKQHYVFDNIIGNSPAMQKVFHLMEKVIPTDTSVLLIGETGTGKELIAKAIHYNGPRKSKLFVGQNCTALPDNLLESELFGHVKGSFTGAINDKKGLFEIADGGTILLDEIGDTSPAMQQRLLRVLQEGEIRRVGGEKNIKVDVRIISATNKDLQASIKNGTFREDLYYRLSVFPIIIPPLRERREDIPLLAEFFLKHYSKKLNKNIPGIEKEALNILTAAPFPGNVRELENEIHRAVTLAEFGKPVSTDLLSDALKSEKSLLFYFLQQPRKLKEITESIEKYFILEKLKQNHNNITQTAKSLGLSRVGLQKKIKRYKLNFQS
jgi:two-component system response regulator HupR/HoxA